jgi:hypothetical protein
MTAARLLACMFLVPPTLGVMQASSAWGAPCNGTASANAGQQVFNVNANSGCTKGGDNVLTNAHGQPLPPGEVVTTPVCEPGPQGGCIGQKHCPDGQGMTSTYWETTEGEWLDVRDNCSDDDPGPDPGPTQADIRRAFEQVPLPASVLNIQPPGGATLVNFDTNFFTTAKPFDHTVTLLGHRVSFKIRPRSFTWHYGDGEDETTTKPGAAYPALDVTHRYLTKDTVTPSVDTIWEADYQLDGGAWAPVNGTVTKTGAAQQLTIKSATPILVG